MELHWLPWMPSATLAERRAEMAYTEYKCAFPRLRPPPTRKALSTAHSRRQEGLWKPHLAAGIFTLCVSLMFSVVFWENTTLHGTLFPLVYWVQHATYALSGLLELGVSLVMHFAPRFRARYAVFVHFIVSLWFVFVLGFDPYRTFRMLDSNTTYAKARTVVARAVGTARCFCSRARGVQHCRNTAATLPQRCASQELEKWVVCCTRLTSPLWRAVAATFWTASSAATTTATT